MSRDLAVLCVDDQRTFVDALHLAMDADEDGIRCVAVADTVDAALDVLARTAVDVVLMDFDLPGIDGIEGTRRVKARHPDVRVLILTAMADLDLFVRAVAAGADGFFAKDTPLHELLGHVRDRPDGPLSLDERSIAALRARVGDEGSMSGRTWRPELTEREKEVLALLATGVDPKTIARQLGITLHTCRGYVRNVLSKLGAHSQLEAVAVAHRAGLLSR